MNKIPFRQQRPQRTCIVEYKNYRDYKSYLRADFNKRCGYTDCPDNWFGGSRTFHIDHFRPKGKNPQYKSAYSNLIYACSYVNILKSDDDEGFFLDPCDVDFNEYFYRTNSGEIRVTDNSPEASYMYNKLQLYLQRYSIIWTLERIQIMLNQLQIYRKKTSKEDEHYDQIRDLIVELDDKFQLYINYLTANQ